MKSNGKLCPLGKLVVKALTDQEKTKSQLAAEIGTSPQYLSYILYGVRSGEKYLPAIIAALNLDPPEGREGNGSMTTGREGQECRTYSSGSRRPRSLRV